MLDIKTIKENIQNNTLGDYLMIFCGEEFLSKQYIKQIARVKNKKIQIIDNLNSFCSNEFDVFAVEDDNSFLYIYKTKKLETLDENLFQAKNLIIHCNELDKEAKEYYNNNILMIPKLENWMIKDYLYSNLDGIKPKALDWLLDITQHNIYRIENEIAKFKIFPKTKRQELFDQYAMEDGFSDLTPYNIFKLTNAIIKKDIKELREILLDIKNIDVNEIGLVTILHDNFKNIINIQLNRFATAESLNLPQNRFNAIKYNCGYYSKDQLIKNLSFLSSIDFKLKTGKMPVNIMIDYIILKVIGV